MPVDHRIYSQMQAPDILGSVQRGLSMREMIDQRANQKKQMAEQEQIKQAYAKNLIQGENGSVSYNRGGLMSDLVKSGAGREAMAMQDRFSQADARERKIANEQDLKEMEMFARIAPSIKDQISFEKGKQFLEQRGIDTSKLGNVYDKGIVDRYAMGVTSYLDQMKLKNQER